MGHHKRHRSKSRRAGCAMCKWWKQNGIKGGLEAQTIQERKAREAEEQQIEHYYEDIYPSDPYGSYDPVGAIYWDWENTQEDYAHTWTA